MGRFVVVLVVGLVACRPPYLGGDDDGTDPDAPTDDTVPLRSCTTPVSFRTDATVIAADVAGQWDWSARTPLADADHDGTFTGELDLPPGLWAYKLVVTRASGSEWILDPGNPYRAYEGGVENSAFRVPDCAMPQLELAAHDANTTRVRMLRGKPGAPITELAATLDGAPIDVVRAGAELTIATPSLATGKHTLRITARDETGAEAEALLVPFWVESEAF